MQMERDILTTTCPFVGGKETWKGKTDFLVVPPHLSHLKSHLSTSQEGTMADEMGGDLTLDARLGAGHDGLAVARRASVQTHRAVY